MTSQDWSTRILVVDDDPAWVKLLEKHLTDEGHEVLTAQNGREGMRVVPEQGPQLVITDWLMPEMDGLEFCRALRAHEGVPFVYVIIVTAQREKERTLEAFQAGVDDFLTKPVQKDEILARLWAAQRIIQLQTDLDRQYREVHLVNAKMALAARELEAANEKLHQLATTDELTGLLNRREAMNRLAEHWASTERHGEPLACIMVDIDHFKGFNDQYGHAFGDLVLKETSHMLQNTTRIEERACRIGGEEFLIICPKATVQEAAEGAERIRRAVEAQAIRCGRLKLTVTISLGVAERTALTATCDDLLRAADEALYAAKAGGRNTVRMARETAVTA